MGEVLGPGLAALLYGGATDAHLPFHVIGLLLLGLLGGSTHLAVTVVGANAAPEESGSADLAVLGSSGSPGGHIRKRSFV